MKILFVCTGNTCRSPMAEGLLRKMLKEKWGEKAQQVEIASAGLAAFAGSPASCQALDTMLEEGIDLSRHKSQPLKEELVKESDLILAMTTQHKQHVIEKFPFAADKVFVLKEYTQNAGQIADKKDRIKVLHRRISEKQRDFFIAYQDEIDTLKRKYQTLRDELLRVQDDLNHYEERLTSETYEERKELEQLLKETEHNDIVDPFGQPPEAYRQCASQLKEIMESVIKMIEKENKQ